MITHNIYNDPNNFQRNFILIYGPRRSIFSKFACAPSDIFTYSRWHSISYKFAWEPSDDFADAQSDLGLCRSFYW